MSDNEVDDVELEVSYGCMLFVGVAVVAACTGYIFGAEYGWLVLGAALIVAGSLGTVGRRP